ncbi:AAC(3) family N-acetyltransferase [Flavobacterium sp.]|uniref:AAC(3) family N-acetyltransferase n=1 Tax=Flavobacterium sp. TaxID=239 RepID=UPI0025C2169D|nr:AAC(3) family N-acetyltransferase [Flavobacterium sp.]
MKEEIIKVLNDNQIQRMLVHSDLMHGFKIQFSNRIDYLKLQMIELNKFERELWMPAFNYDFCKGGDYSIVNSRSQVGILSEHFRINNAFWRTNTPIFSISGNGEEPKLAENEIIDPFGKESSFEYLYINNGALMHYGSTFSSSTILHYIERISGNLVYRYDKIFIGNVLTNDNLLNKKIVTYHVRPLNHYFEYNWVKLEKELIENDILFEFQEDSTRILVCNIRKLVDFWIEKLNVDSLYFLDEKTKKWVEPMLDKLGRKFLISDFE